MKRFSFVAAIAVGTLVCNVSTRADVQKSLDLIRDFASSLCGSVETKGKAEAWDTSAEAKASLNGVVKKLADLGATAATKYTHSSYEGLLQTDIGKIIEKQGDCRLEVFRELKDKLLPGAPIQSTTTEMSASNARNGSSEETHSASRLVLGGFGRSIDALQSQGIDFKIRKEQSTNGKFVTYTQSIYGRQFEVTQNLDSAGNTGLALAKSTLVQSTKRKDLIGETMSTAGDSDNAIYNLCSQDSLDRYLKLFTKDYGLPNDVKEWARTEHESDDSSSRKAYEGGASWRFTDNSRLVLRIRELSTFKDDGNYERWGHSCSVQICAVPIGQAACFTVPGLAL
ncbi:hypothetical protein AWB79_01297 [Caballeronia hypogeia]|uniref:Uncharacterized protein n=1 Tax=Caballeronia hypogeia TaxID=1777140 RepID=A0A157ZUA7_9BURK|nr:hypothetical protein [Caballeronia hypogeia]SAK48507.1 hypothetical protein AWB79_01297 [Caballeronia hypogeia]